MVPSELDWNIGKPETSFTLNSVPLVLVST
jgi:hypothetical protein